MRVLLAEDTQELSSAIAYMLTHNKYVVDVVENGCDALEYGLTGIYDIILLDILMPGMDGIQVLKQLRQNGIHTPILVLSAKNELDDRVSTLDCGADDYLSKPFAITELLARMRALLRRNEHYISDLLSFGNLTLDVRSYEMATPNGKLRLSSKEFQLMSCFLRNPKCIFSSGELLDKVWGWDAVVETNVIWTYITYIRRKLEQINANVQIQSIRAVGYRLTEKE